ncbi:hypothetical protein [Tolypothrix sp. NIES-4075]|uniref:hypothetical protein n=1 Tax=Tolypothrix sp. NIES-4075 TaxID=2005459 RepID=UPI00118056F0|nr:hypothetical protein [Tolypothrix sp. NIES-4075]
MFSLLSDILLAIAIALPQASLQRKVGCGSKTLLVVCILMSAFVRSKRFIAQHPQPIKNNLLKH